MDLKVVRTEFTPECTIGELFVDADFECFTLEDVVRPVKIKGMTAISAGIYEVVINQSARFNRLLPLLLNVPNFDGVRIHAGNTAADTEGCILVGEGKGSNAITGSRNAFGALFAKMQAAAAREKIFIEIVSADGVGASRGAMTMGESVRRGMTAPLAAFPADGDDAAARKPAGRSAETATRAKRGSSRR